MSMVSLATLQAHEKRNTKGLATDNGITLSRSIDRGKARISIKVGRDLMKEMRWSAGDTVDVQVDTKGRIGWIGRVNSLKAWTLYGKGSGRVTITLPENAVNLILPEGTDVYRCKNLEKQLTSVAFDLP